MKEKIVIVGNGMSCLNNENGSLIDSCETVIRIGQFKIEGFEKFVGTKFDVYSACNTKGPFYPGNDLDIISFLEKYNIKSCREMWFMEPKIFCDQWYKGLFPSTGINIKYHDIFEDVIRNTSEEIQLLKVNKYYNYFEHKPSTGILCIQKCLRETNVDNFEIFITGFDKKDDQWSGWYWDKSCVGRSNFKHNYELEKRIIEYYCDKNLIKRID